MYMNKVYSLVLALMISSMSISASFAEAEISVVGSDFISNIDESETFTITITSNNGTFADESSDLVAKLASGVELKATLVGIFLTQNNGSEKEANKKIANKFVEFEEKGQVTITAEPGDSSATGTISLSIKDKALKALQKQLANGAEFVSPVFIIKAGDKETKALLKNGELVFINSSNNPVKSGDNFASIEVGADGFFQNGDV